ncbi:hypothetical protein WJX74_006648 [Apatococcus lobatus]|uniref:Transcription initiation factor IIA subunit 2 n=1 Tax=Apatococcus lobatus TaxID=904363 RepID=A0AAW1Q9Q8_9CHLO
MSLQHYRTTAFGECLVDSLDNLVTSGKISGDLAIKVLAEFDQSFYEAIARSAEDKLTFKAKLDTYRGCDNVWTFEAQDAVFTFPPAQTAGMRAPGPKATAQEIVVEGKLKIVSVDQKLMSET